MATPTDPNPAHAAPVNILSLDGGGIRGYSSLQILEQVMLKIQSELGLPDPPKPCDHFDLIGGTSTGGIIAILLGRLRLSVADALAAYDSVASKAFVPRLLYTPTGGKYKADSLKRIIQDVVKEKDRNRDPEAVFVDLEAPKTVVLSITTVDVDSGPTFFRSYDTQPPFNACKIWEIARATSAAYSYFESIEIGRDHIEFMDAGFGHNNPCIELVRESKRIFPDRSIGCILSIGTGLGRATEASSMLTVGKALVKMATSSKNVDREMQTGEYKDVYTRLDEDAGVSEIKMDNYRKMSALAGLTLNYIRKPATDLLIKSCVERILSSRTNSTPDVPRDLFFEVDYPRNSKFVQQSDALRYLQTTFPPSKQTQIRRAVVYGMGGVGKTQVALDYAYMSQSAQSVFWINADNRGSLEQRVKEILGSVGRISPFQQSDLNGPGRSGAFIRMLRRWLESEHSGWLLVLDNVGDSKIITDLLPSRGHGDILCTTRNQGIVGSDIFPGRGYKLQSMSERDAITVFLNRLLAILDFHNPEIQSFIEQFSALTHNNDSATHTSVLSAYLSSTHGITKFPELQDITNLVGRLPLGLVQSAAYMSATNYPVTYTEYKKRLQASVERRKAFFNFDVSSSYDQNLWSVWKLSFDQIRETRPEASNLMNFMAFLDRSSLTLEFLSSTLDEGRYWDGKLVFKMNADELKKMAEFLPCGEEGADLENSLRELSKLSLLDTVPDSHTVEMHKLVQDYLVLQMSNSVFQQFLRYSVAILMQRLPPLLYSKNDIMVPALANQVLPHIGRLGQVIRERVNQIELNSPTSRDIAALFLTAYRWTWDPEDLDLAAYMMRKEEPDHWLILLINSSLLFLETSKQMQNSVKDQNRDLIIALTEKLFSYGDPDASNQSSSRKPGEIEKSWSTVASSLRDFAEPPEIDESSIHLEENSEPESQGSRPAPHDKAYERELRGHFNRARSFLCSHINQWALEKVTPESIEGISQAVLLTWFGGANNAFLSRISSAVAGLDLGLDEINGFGSCFFQALQEENINIEDVLKAVRVFLDRSSNRSQTFSEIPFPYLLEHYNTEVLPFWMELATDASLLEDLPWPVWTFNGSALTALETVLLTRVTYCLNDLQNKSEALSKNTRRLYDAHSRVHDEQHSDFDTIVSICRELNEGYCRTASALDSQCETNIQDAMIDLARLFHTPVSELSVFYENCYEISLRTKGMHQYCTKKMADMVLLIYQSNDRLKAKEFELSVASEIDMDYDRSTWAMTWLCKSQNFWTDFDLRDVYCVERHGDPFQDMICCALSTNDRPRIIWTRSSLPSKPVWDVFVSNLVTLVDFGVDQMRLLQVSDSPHYFRFTSVTGAESFTTAFRKAGGECRRMA